MLMEFAGLLLLGLGTQGSNAVPRPTIFTGTGTRESRGHLCLISHTSSAGQKRQPQPKASQPDIRLDAECLLLDQLI